MNALELPSLKSQAPSFTQIEDEDDDEGNEEEQMMLIMNQIRAHQKKKEKRKLQKDFDVKSKEACARFKKQAAPDLASLKKRRRTKFEELQSRVDQVAENQMEADNEFKAAHNDHQIAFENLVACVEKAQSKLIDLKARTATLQSTFADESEHGREVLSPWVSEASDVMSDKIRHIEESEPPKKSGMMAQMWQMMGAR